MAMPMEQSVTELTVVEQGDDRPFKWNLCSPFMVRRKTGALEICEEHKASWICEERNFPSSNKGRVAITALTTCQQLACCLLLKTHFDLFPP